MGDIFHFKHFSVKQNQCAMKVGTDGVLLGAWVNLFPNTSRILDVGSGTGIIALMLAQRCPKAKIDGIEQDHNAYEQGVNNFQNSHWKYNLFNFHGTFQNFSQESEGNYDLIICNPPFFNQGRLKISDQRSMARNSEALPLETLIKGASNLLVPFGRLAMIIPHELKRRVLFTLKQYDMLVLRMTSVRGNKSRPPKRLLIEVRSKITKTDEYSPEISELIIENTRHNYTKEYRNLVHDFYLKI